MQYDYNEFYVSNLLITLNSREIELLPLSLKNLQRLEDKFCELKNLEDFIKNDPKQLFKVIWLFVANKEQFSYSYTDFLNFINAGSILDNTKTVYKTLHKLIVNSSPIVKNKERHEAIQAIKKAKSEENNTKPCFANIYDKFASRYSMSIDSFYDMTMRQVHALIEVMDKNEHKELEVQAALMGKKLKPKLNAHAIDAEEDERLDQEAESMLERIKKEYEMNKAKNNE